MPLQKHANFLELHLKDINFKMKDVNEASYIISIDIHSGRSQRTLGLSQKACIIRKVLERFRMKRYSSTIALIDKGEKFNQFLKYISAGR